jgi:hypothetical protein
VRVQTPSAKCAPGARCRARRGGWWARRLGCCGRARIAMWSGAVARARAPAPGERIHGVRARGLEPDVRVHAPVRALRPRGPAPGAPVREQAPVPGQASPGPGAGAQVGRAHAAQARERAPASRAGAARVRAPVAGLGVARGAVVRAQVRALRAPGGPVRAVVRVPAPGARGPVRRPGCRAWSAAPRPAARVRQTGRRPAQAGPSSRFVRWETWLTSAGLPK